jgi:uroporphyrinogen decarboxylase
MGQVVRHPLAEARALAAYRPPDPRDPFYFERIEPLLAAAGGRYVVVACHFNLIERLHFLRGFGPAMEGFRLEPDVNHRALDLILEFKLGQLAELHRRFGDRIDGIFLTDDWGTQRGLLAGPFVFEEFFAARYEALFGAIRSRGWHVILHSDGRINALVPRLIELGVHAFNLQQPRACGIVEFGEAFRGRACFFTTADIQATLPRGREEEVREEVRLLVRHWSTPAGGLVAFDYGDPALIGAPPAMTRAMFEEFTRLKEYWRSSGPG